MDEYRIARRVLMAEVSGGRVRGRPKTEVRLDGWCEGGLRQQRNDVEAARQCAKDRKEWRALVHM